MVTIGDRVLSWIAISAFFCAPLSKPGTNIALGLLVLAIPFASNWRQRLAVQVQSPVVIAGAAMFIVYAVSALHTNALTNSLWAYRTLFAIGLVALALPTDDFRLRAWSAFIAGSATLFFFSLAYGVGLVPRVSVTAIGQFGFAKHYGQQALIYITSGAACASFLLTGVYPRHRKHLMILTAAFALSTPLILEGRMSWIVLGGVVILLGVHFFGVRRGLLSGVCVLMGIIAVAWVSPLQSGRWSAAKDDVGAALSYEVRSSWGVRAELLRIAPLVIAKAPFFGHGLSTWNEQMKAVAPDRMNELIKDLVNPHQELLFIASEQGLFGAAVFLGIALLLVRCVVRMRGTAKPLYIALTVTYLGYGLFNAVLADFTHRHVFVLLLAAMPLNFRNYQISGASFK
jgi:O-antigen ligase